MAIQPIDLQTMYSQMANVASKVSHEQHGVQMTAAIQQQTAVTQNAESLKTVKKTAGDESKTGLIKEDGQQNMPQSNSSEKNKKEKSDEENIENSKTEIREDFLGRHIDITR